MTRGSSHAYDFRGRDVSILLAGPLIPLFIFASSMHLGAHFHWFPPPRPALDVDRTILLHQIDASGRPGQADVLLLGDSSCLMDVSARRLEEKLGTNHVLNLGSLSYLSVQSQARLLSNYARCNPGKPRAVLLLMHPESLRLAAHDSYYDDLLESVLEDRDPRGRTRLSLAWWSGAEIFKSRFLSRVIPSPLPGLYGSRYGFTWNLWNFMTENQGSAVDPHRYDARSSRGSAEYRLAPRLQQAARAFRDALPPGARLFAGITPSPRTFVLPNHETNCAAMLEQWSAWLPAAPLGALPSSLPDEFFASPTHLAPPGILFYTDQLAQTLSRLLANQ